MIQCRTLGPVDVTVNGAAPPAELLWRKNLALLLYLARSPNGRARDHLIGLLWPDKPERDARHSLNEALRVLRRVTGEEGLETSATRIRLAENAVEVDADQFERFSTAGNWTAACQLIGGEFVEGFSVPGAVDFEHWLAAERTLWRSRCVEALSRHTESLLASGHSGPALALARRAFALDPHADVVIRTLMRTLALSGDPAAASAAYESFKSRLAADVGSQPAQETVALAERIARARIGPIRLAPTPRADATSRRAPLVERDGELVRLGVMWEDCRTRQHTAVALVTGDPGTGKSRLGEEARARAILDGAAAALVRAVEADATEAWGGVFAVAQGLVHLQGVAAAPPAALACFAGRLPEWADRFAAALRTVTPDTPGHALRDVLRAVILEQPLFLVVDDAHWLDRDSLLALIATTRDLAATPLCLLLTRAAQPPREELDDLQSRIGRDVPGEVIRLAPLSMRGLRDLAQWALPNYGGEQLDRVTRRLATDSAGLPLLAVELLQAVTLGLDLDRNRAAWPQPLRTLDETLPGDLPETVVGAIRVTFRRLGKTAQEVVRAMAVLGDRVTPMQVENATGFAHADVTAALDELEFARWLVAEPRGYAFLARIVGQTIERDLVTTGQKQRLREAGR